MKKVLLSIIASSLILLSYAQVPGYVPTSGLVGWWPFNGNANDESGNGLNGTFTNGSYLASPYNQSANFNGTNSIISIPINSLFDTDSFSISIRIKNNVSPFHNPIQFGIVSGPMRWSIGFQSNQIYYAPMTCAGGWGATSNAVSISLNDFSWYHIVWLNEGTRTKFYLNGQLIGDINNAVPTICWDPAMLWYLGGDIGGGDIEYYNGEMDELGFWNRVLTECEIQQLYNASFLSSSQSPSICNGSSFNVGINSYDSTGVYTDTLVSSNNCDSIVTTNLTVIDCSGIEDELLSQVSMYPNPATSIINLMIPEKLIGSSFQILDYSGRQVCAGMLTEINAMIDLSSLAKGVYIIQIGEQKISLKLIKE